MKKIFALAILLVVSNSVFSQTKKSAKTAPASTTTTGFKIGYIFEDYIFEKANMVKELDSLIKGKQEFFQDNYNKLALEYQTKYLDYQNSLKNLDTLTTETLNARLKKVQEIKSASENYQRQAEKEFQALTGEGVMKIKEEILEAAKIVAKEKGYGFVLSRNKSDGPMSPNRVILYAGDAGKGDLSDLVIAKMNAKKK
jgi:outer membrane protein